MREASYIYAGDENGFNLLKARDPLEFSIQDNIQNTLLVSKEDDGLIPLMHLTFLKPLPSSVFWLYEIKKTIDDLQLIKMKIVGLE